MKYAPALFLTLLAGGLATASAGPLTEAQVHHIVNDVKIVDPQKGARPAAVRDTVRDQIAVRTGMQSRAELLFQDATLTRLGAETLFSFKAGTRDLSLERGTLLLQVPKGRGGARIRTASVTASITGTTIMIEHLPGNSVKVLVLEGSLRLSSNSRFGEAVNLKPGKMVIMKPNATKIPDPVDVDLRKVMKTSALIDAALFAGKPGKTVAALPSIPLIEKEIAKQDTLLEKQGLVRTNLVIPGSGTKVLLASDETLAQLEQTTTNARKTAPETSPLASAERQAAAALNDTQRSLANTSGSTNPTNPPSTLLYLRTASTTNGSFTTPTTPSTPTTPTMPATPTTPVTPSPNDLVFTANVDQDTFTATGRLLASGNVGSRTIDMGGAIEVDGALHARAGSATDGSTYLIRGTTVRAGTGLWYNGASKGQTVLGTLFNGPQAGGDVTILADRVEFSALAINGAYLRGGDGITTAGGDGGTLRVGTALAPIAGDVVFDAPVVASTGLNSLLVPWGGKGGTVEAEAIGPVSVSSTIKVSDTALLLKSNEGGKISLKSAATSDQALRVTSSGQLLSLLDNAATGPGGTIRLVATNGGVEVDGGTVRADRGTVEIKGRGTSSRVTLNNANIRGDTVKIGALGANGELRIGGGTINADSTLKLYGGSSNGTVRFTNDVTLSGASAKIIAGNTVTIDNGRTVTVGGPAATVHTNNPNYTGSGGNGSTTGQFGGSGATTQSYGSRPAF